MKKLTYLVCFILTASILQGCGFKLRGKDVIPAQFSQLYITSQQKHSPIERILKTRLVSYDVKVTDDLQLAASNQITQIRLQNEKLDRRLLSLFSTGQVAEYELVYELSYVIIMPNQGPQTFTIELSRQFQDDPDAVLAKSRELDLILNEVRKLAADQIVRKLATL